MKTNNGMTQPYVLQKRQDRQTFLRLAIDERHHDGYPIDRIHGHVVTDQRAMRQGVVKTITEHLAELETAHPREMPTAYIGNGNHLANPGFVRI